MTLEAYLAKRRYWEVALGVGVLMTSLLANIGTVWIDLERVESPTAMQTALILEITSHAALAVCVPFIVWFDRYATITAATWRRSLLAHVGFSVVFSLTHVVLMYWARIAVYGAYGIRYHWDNPLLQFFYEYLKDFRTYMLIVVLIYLYRFIIRRLQGEAGFLSEGRDDSEQEPVHDRFLVKKLGREFLVRLDDIDWIEASGNYVNLHVGGKVYPLRGTMTSINDRLSNHGFQRVHRSAIVNLDRIAEIVAFDTGDGEAHLTNAATVPVSRRFRKELRERLG